jgi:hypothetical protein
MDVPLLRTLSLRASARVMVSNLRPVHLLKDHVFVPDAVIVVFTRGHT